jgi:hypothetical protein
MFCPACLHSLHSLVCLSPSPLPSELLILSRPIPHHFLFKASADLPTGNGILSLLKWPFCNSYNFLHVYYYVHYQLTILFIKNKIYYLTSCSALNACLLQNSCWNLIAFVTELRCLDHKASPPWVRWSITEDWVWPTLALSHFPPWMTWQ